MVKIILTPSTYSTISSNLVDPIYTGVGTSNPRYTLDIVGNLNISGKLYVNNTIFTGSGTAGNEVWKQNGTAIYYTNGNVGIGSSSPISSLDLNSIRIYNNGAFGRIVMNANRTSTIEGIGVLGSNSLRFSHNSGLTSAIELTDSQMAFYVASNESMRLNPNGSLGIGTTLPYQQLHLEKGICYISSNLLIGTTNGTYRLHIQSGTSNSQDRSLMIENKLNGDAGVAFKNTSIQPNLWSIGISSNNTRLDFSYGSTFNSNNVKLCIQTDGMVGINTTNPRYPLDLRTFASETSNDTIVGKDVSTSSFLLLGPNLTPISRALYLPLNSSNVSLITSYLQYTFSSLSKSWWSKSSPFYTQVSYTTTNNFYWGSILIPDGRVVLTPWLGSATVGVFNPMTNIFSTYPSTSAGFFAYQGSVVVPDGRVIFIPSGVNNIGVFNPTTNTFSTIPITAPPYSTQTGDGYYGGGVVVPDGRVIFVPDGTNTVGIFNPSTNTFSTVPFTDPNIGFLYKGAVLTLDGRVVFVPNGSDSVGIFDPRTNTYSTVSGLYVGQNVKYTGGVLLPDGRVLFIPNEVTSLGQKKFTYFNPITNTITFGSTSANSPRDYYGGVSLPDGRVLFIPSNKTTFDIFDPTLGSVVSQTSGAPGNSAYRGGSLLPDGRVFLSPQRVSGGTYFYGLLSGFQQPIPEMCFHPCYNKF